MKTRVGILLSVLGIVGLLATSALAAPGNGKAVGHGDTRPGWGYGDTNHTHTGPRSN
jgi:hypothetical protein